MDEDHKAYILLFPAIFFVAVLFSVMSGNDKAPFIVIATAFIIFIYSLVLGLKTLFSDVKDKKRNLLLTGALLTILYILVVVILSKQGAVDSYFFLGLR